jgi:hypothetical protein
MFIEDRLAVLRKLLEERNVVAPMDGPEYFAPQGAGISCLSPAL